MCLCKTCDYNNFTFRVGAGGIGGRIRISPSLSGIRPLFTRGFWPRKLPHAWQLRMGSTSGARSTLIDGGLIPVDKFHSSLLHEILYSLLADLFFIKCVYYCCNCYHHYHHRRNRRRSSSTCSSSSCCSSKS